MNDGARKRVGKEVAQAAADDRVIVHEHHAQRRRTRRHIGFAAGRVVANGRGHVSWAPARGSRIPSLDALGTPRGSRGADPGSRISGSFNSTRVPWPARLVMRSVPPTVRARSLIP